MEVPDNATIYHKSIFHGLKLWYKSKIDGSIKITYCGPEADLSDRGLRRLIDDFLKLETKEKIEWNRFLEESALADNEGLPQFEDVKLFEDDEVEWSKRHPGKWKRKLDWRNDKVIREQFDNQDALTEQWRQNYKK